MQPEIKAKWLEALRSGRYAQTTGELFDGEKFCCLGVLCDVISPNWGQTDDEGETYIAHEFGDSNEILDPTFREEIGIPSDVQDKLTQMNDDEKASFAQIADWIEKNL